MVICKHTLTCSAATWTNQQRACITSQSGPVRGGGIAGSGSEIFEIGQRKSHLAAPPFGQLGSLSLCVLPSMSNKNLGQGGITWVISRLVWWSITERGGGVVSWRTSTAPLKLDVCGGKARTTVCGGLGSRGGSREVKLTRPVGYSRLAL